MQIQRTVLAEAVKKCLPGVETGTALIEGTDTLVFTKGALHSYNDSIHVSVVLPDSELEGVVKAKEFSKLVAKLNGEVVTIELIDSKWTLTCGATEVELPLYSDNITQHLNTLNLANLKWAPLSTDFQEGLKLTKIGGNTNPVRGAFIQGKKLYSTDTIRINEYTLDVELPPFWIDDPAVGELLKIGSLADFAVGTAWVHFRTKDNTIFSAKLKEYSLFPIDGLKGHIDAALAAPVLAGNKLPLALGEAVERVAVFGADLQGVVSVGMSIRQDHIQVYSGRATGKAKEKVPLTVPFTEDPKVTCSVDFTFIVEAAAKVAEFEVKDVGGQKLLRFFTEKYNQLAVTVVSE